MHWSKEKGSGPRAGNIKEAAPNGCLPDIPQEIILPRRHIIQRELLYRISGILCTRRPAEEYRRA